MADKLPRLGDRALKTDEAGIRALRLDSATVALWEAGVVGFAVNTRGAAPIMINDKDVSGDVN
jgi:hypothetical protein